MAQPLTWRDVAAPDYRGVQQGINSAAELFNRAATGLSGATTQYGDQQTLQQLAAYQDAQKLQEALQSGQFNTANASPEALKTIQSRAGELITNAGNQQKNIFDALMNPQKLAYQGVLNNQAEFNLGQDQYGQKRLENVTNVRADDAFARSELNRVAQEEVGNDLRTLQMGGQINNIGDFIKVRDSQAAAGKSPSYLQALTAQGKSLFPELDVPLATLTGSTAGTSSGSLLSNAANTFNAQNAELLAKTETANGLPTNYLKGVVNIEGGTTGKASPTGALGAGQFVETTWNSLANAPEGKALGMRLVTAANKGTPDDPRRDNNVNIQATGLLAKQNGSLLDKAGVAKTPENLFLVHNIGPGIIEGIKTGKVDDQTTQFMKLNGFKEGDSVKGWIDQTAKKFIAGANQETPSRASVRTGAEVGKAAIALGEQNSIVPLVNQMVKSFGSEDSSLASTVKKLSGKEGTLSNSSPEDISENLIFAMKELGVNAPAAARVLEEAGTADWKLSLRPGTPWFPNTIDKTRLEALVKTLKSSPDILKAVQTGANNKELVSGIDTEVSAMTAQKAVVDKARRLDREQGTPATAANLLREQARLAEFQRDAGIENTNVVTQVAPNLPNLPPPKPVATPVNNAAALLNAPPAGTTLSRNLYLEQQAAAAASRALIPQRAKEAADALEKAKAIKVLEEAEYQKKLKKLREEMGAKTAPGQLLSSVRF
jgi:hypothetical protein